MAKLSKDAERAIKQAEQVVEETIDRTGDAIEHYADTMQKAFSSFQFSSKELTDKMQSFTQANIEAAQKFVQKLSQAKDFQDVIRIQTEYIQNQFHVFGEQTKSLTEEFTKAPKGPVNNPFKNY